MDAFGNLGLNLNALNTLSKKDQFLAIADAIARLGDEAKQTDAAMKIFGRGGTALLPMFQEGRGGIQNLMVEADKLGIGISDADAAKAEILSSSITRFKQSFQGLRRTIVSSLVEPCSQILDWSSKVMRNFREWANVNQSTVASFLKIGTASTGAAMGLAVLWRYFKPIKSLFMGTIGFVKKWGTTLLRLVPTLLSLLNPLGWIRLAVLGAVSAFAYFTGAGSQLMSWLNGFGAKIKGTFASAFGDLVPPIQEGRVLDAVKLLWLKIQLFFEEGRIAIINKWNEVAAAVSEPFMAIYDAIATAVIPAVQWLRDTFQGLGDWMADQFATPMQWLCEMFGQWWSYIGKGWDALMNDTGAVIVGTWWSIATGVNEAIAFIRNAWNDILSGIQLFILDWARDIIAAFDRVAQAVDFTGYVSSATSAVVAEIDKMIAGVEDRAIQTGISIEGDKKDWQDYFDDSAQKSLSKVDAAKANAPKTSERAEALKLQIAELKKPVKTNDPKTETVNQAVRQTVQQAKASSIVSGTMNKADILGGALAFMASEKSDMEDVAENTEEMVGLLRGIKDNTRHSGAMVYS
jgi:hypothetical protein